MAVRLHILRRQGPRSHQAHFPPQDVYDLRQLIQAVTAQEAADRGDARVVLYFENVPLLLPYGNQALAFLFNIHRAQFQECEVSASFADSTRFVKNRPRGSKLDQKADQDKRGEQQRDPD